MNTQQKPVRLVVVSAGTSDPSTTRLLADRTAQRVIEVAGRRDHTAAAHVIDLRELAIEITTALVSQLVGPKLQGAVSTLADADGIIVSTPVYKAGPSGLLTSFLQILDNVSYSNEEHSKRSWAWPGMVGLAGGWSRPLGRASSPCGVRGRWLG